MHEPETGSARPRSLSARLAALPDALAAGLLAVVTVLVTAQVVVRYGTSGSLVWSEELTRLLFVWMVLIAAVTAPRMQVDFVVELMPARGQAVLRLLSELLVIAITCVLIYGAWGMMELTEFDTYIALGISVRWLYLSMFLAACAWLLRSGALAIGQIRMLLK